MTQVATATQPSAQKIPVARGLEGQVYPDALATDPQAMGWMQGEPVPVDKRIAFAEASVCRAAYIFATCHLIIPDTAIATINIEMNISTKEKPATPVFCIYSPRHR